MKKQTTRIILGLIVVAVIIVFLVVPNYGSNTPVEDNILKIGVTLPLSGDLSFIGESEMNSIEIAVNELRAENPDVEIEVIYMDDKFTPTDAISNFNKLVSVDDVDVVISAGSPVAVTLAPLAQEKQVIHFGMASAAFEKEGDMNFNHWTPPKAEAEKLVEKISGEGVEEVSILSMNHEGAAALAEEVVKSLELNDIKINIHEKVNPGSKDFRTSLNKIDDSNPEYLVFIMMTPEAELAARQIKELGLEYPIASIETPDFSPEPELFNGNWFINAAEPTEKFLNKYESEYGKNPSIFAGNSYDIIKVIGEVYIEDGKVIKDHMTISDKLTDLGEYNAGGVGPFTINTDGTFVSEAVVRMMTDGKATTI